jgi:hypothetical protein
VDAATGDTSVRPLSVEQLYRSADLSGLAFSTTTEPQPIDGLVGQARARSKRSGSERIGNSGK